MTEAMVLNEQRLRSLVPLDLQAVDAIEECFRKLAMEAVVMPPVMRLDIEEHNGEVDVKSAYLPGMENFAIKISPGFFDNPKLGLPSLNGLMVLLSARTGLLQAMLLDNGYLTAVRTAAAGAVAARWLSREDSRTAGIIGAGEQARLQLRALCLVRSIERALVWARDEERANAYATEMNDQLGIPVEVAGDREALVRQSDIVVTTTPSRDPLVDAAWLEPGLHLTAMGSDSEHKNELEPQVVTRADLYVCDRSSQCRSLGELHHAIDSGLLAEDDDFPELGEVIAGSRSGRTDPQQITVCDLTGTGAQDSAIAALAYARAEGISSTDGREGDRPQGDEDRGHGRRVATPEAVSRPDKERA
ncbi:MAG TPA: cyclodeaminase [Trueperaceae bacterium]